MGISSKLNLNSRYLKFEKRNKILPTPFHCIHVYKHSIVHSHNKTQKRKTLYTHEQLEMSFRGIQRERSYPTISLMRASPDSLFSKVVETPRQKVAALTRFFLMEACSTACGTRYRAAFPRTRCDVFLPCL